MEINYLVDEVERLVNTGRRVPFSALVMIEEEKLLAIVEQFREAIPAEIKQAKRIIQDQDRIMKSAQAEADKIVSMARERAEYLIREDTVFNLAKERGEQVLGDAQRDAVASRQEIDEYAVAVLSNMQDQLEAQLQQVRNGLRQMQGHPFARVS